MAKTFLWVAVGVACATVVCVSVLMFIPKQKEAPPVAEIDRETAERLRQTPPGDADSIIPVHEVYSILWDDWDRAKQRYNFQFRAREFEPLTGNRGRFIKPVYVLYRYLQRRVVTLKIEADELIGTYKREGGASRVRPEEGEMTGNVRIVIDRGDPNKAEADNVHIALDDLQFRDRMRQFTSRGPVAIRSQEMDLDGIGLVATRTESDAQFQSLRILRGKQMVVRQGLGRFGLGTGRDTPAAAPSAPVRPAVAESPAPAPTPAAPGAKPAVAEPAKARESQPYRCVFFGPNIKAVMGSRILTSDERMVVDFQMESEDLADEQAAAPAARPRTPAATPTAATEQPAPRPAAAAPTTRPAAEPARPKPQETIITWEGEMQLMPLPPTRTDPGEERFNLVATGRRVTVQEGDALAVGQKFTFSNLTDSGLLEAAEGKKVHTRWSESLTLDGDAVRFDMNSGQAVVEGAGRLVAPMDPDEPAGPDNQIQVTWDGNIHLRTVSYMGVDRHGNPVEKMRFEAADFSKNVLFALPDGTRLSGDKARVEFFSPEELADQTKAPPGADGASRSMPTMAFKRVIVSDGAKMTYAGQTLTGEQIEIRMKFVDGRPAPDKLIATGNAVSSEDFRVTRADRLEADITVAVTEEVIFKDDVPVAIVKKRKTVVGDVLATGHVDSFDTREGYRVLGDSLQRSGRTKQVRIEGKPARVFTETNLIVAPVVLLDPATRGMNVPGAGEMVLISDRDLQGNTVKTRYRVRWMKDMQYAPADDQATFEGNVTVLTRSDISEGRVDCGRLQLTMKPRSRAAADAPATRPAGAAEDAPATRPAVASLGAVGGMGRLEHVDARGKVVIILDDLDALGLPAQRTRISGEHLVMNAAHGTVRVVDPGTLYWYGRGDAAFRTAADTAPATAEQTQPTRIISTWSKSMLYHMRTRKADLNGDARVVILGRGALAENMNFGGGRGSGKTRLISDNMVLAFKSAGGEDAPGPATAMMPTLGGGGGLKHVLATGRVYGEYNDLTIVGRKLDFDVVGGQVTILGDAQTDAQLYRMSATGKMYDRFVGPMLRMNTRTGELDAARSRIRYHPEPGGMQGPLE